jgi:outer membrane protein insertion porin family
VTRRGFTGRTLLFTLLLLATLGSGATVRGQIPTELRGRPVLEVVVEGETEGLTSAREIGIPLGAPLTRAMLRAATLRLVESGRWADVQLDVVALNGGVRVVAHLVPRLLVARLDVRGNQRVKDDEVARLMGGMARGGELRREELPRALEEVRAHYAERGYERATVNVELWDTDDPARKVVRVAIDEGEPTRITALRFAGEAPPPESRAERAIGLRVGDVLDRRLVHEAIRRGEERLRKEGWLEAALGSARFERHGDGVAVTVPSAVGPRYQVRVAEGQPLDRDAVVAALRLGEERMGESVLVAMRERVVDLFRKHGFLAAEAHVAAVRGREPGTAWLLVKATPGKQIRVTELEFPGAAHFERAFLREQVHSFLQEELGRQSVLEPVDSHTVDHIGWGGEHRHRERMVPRPLEVDPRTVYFAPTYERAIVHIGELYHADGFLEAEVGPPRLERLELQQARVVVPVREGPRTLLHTVEVRGNERLATGTLLEGAGLRRDMPFSHLALERARLAMMEAYLDRGFFYARVDSEVQLSGDRTHAKVVFHVVEGFPVTIGDVLVRGASQTRVSLILNRVPLRSGELYRPALVRQAQVRLIELGIFNSVSIAPADPELPERVKDVIITVTERPTQFIDFSAGVSSGQGVRGGFEYGYRNLFGRAMGLSLRVQLGHRFFFLFMAPEREFDRLSLADRLERLVTLSLIVPHIQALPRVTTSLNLFHQRRNERDFGLDKNGMGVTFTYRGADWFTATLSEDLENNNLDLLFSTASYEELLLTTTDRRLQRLLRVPEGSSTLVASRTTMSLDFRDNPFTPTKGALFSTTAEHTRTLRTETLQVGDTDQSFFSNHFKFVFSATGYFPLSSKVVLASHFRIGRVVHLSAQSQTYPNRRFFMGGVNNLRGYLEDALIPQDLADEIVRNPQVGPHDVLRGGDSFILIRNELRFPLSGDVQGAIFSDMGNLWTQADAMVPWDLRPTAGVGIRLATPVGPIAFDYGVVLLRRPELQERFGAFHFSIGVY